LRKKRRRYSQPPIAAPKRLRLVGFQPNPDCTARDDRFAFRYTYRFEYRWRTEREA
jgi:hypothetical protein